MPVESLFPRLEPLLASNKVQKPIQYVGGELNSVSKDWDIAAVRWALMYPDAYEVGLPNQGVQILYEVLNERDWILAERTYSVWPDMEREMRANHVPQFTLDSHRPVRVFDVFGLSFSTELGYTNLLTALDLAGIPDADVEGHLAGGQAMDTWRAMISAQGGDPDAPLPTPKETHVVTAERDGILVKQEALPFGISAWRLGAGRARKEDPVHHSAGIELHVKPGDAVTKGQALFTLGTDESERFERALEALEGAYVIGDPGAAVENGGALIQGRIAG